MIEHTISNNLLWYIIVIYIWYNNAILRSAAISPSGKTTSVGPWIQNEPPQKLTHCFDEMPVFVGLKFEIPSCCVKLSLYRPWRICFFWNPEKYFLSHNHSHSYSNWWFQHLWKIWIRQIGSSSQLLGKIKIMFQTTNHNRISWWFNIAIENDHLEWVFPLKNGGSFHSYG